MKLTENVRFGKKSFKIKGFTNLGDYTPLHQKIMKGDHALIMMFQPFRGSWMQALACFLSKGCASSTVLHHLIVECVILLEHAGFFVDVITTDGASWNRAMWSKFGITEDNVSCEHICDSTRRLWFCSDFPHLIKHFRNFLIKRSETWSPDGVIKLRHWESLIHMEQPQNFNLKIAPKLCYDDIHPKGYQKMDVGRAYRLFNERTAAAMETYKPQNLNLKDCQPTVDLIKRISKLIKAMSSRTPFDHPLKSGSEEEQYLSDFIKYLDEWSANTSVGLKITIKATIEVMDYLCGTHGYKYLMTSRLNQDALERFFGMMRTACGSNDHPDSALFIQIFKLLSTYSLIKPPKRSNTEGTGILKALLNIEDLSENEAKNRVQRNFDDMLENGLLEEQAGMDTSFQQYRETVEKPSGFILSYISGYVARKATRFTNCSDCLDSLKSAQPGPTDELIVLLSEGYLTYPSQSLYNLILTLETHILSILANTPIHTNLFFEILYQLEAKEFPQVGCAEHSTDITDSIVKFFLTTRMHFICRTSNTFTDEKREKTKQLRKQAKL